MTEIQKKYNIDNAKNDIENLQDQNKYDFQEIKRLGELIQDYDKKVLQSINFNNQINKKIQDDYKNTKKVIIDENVSAALDKKIDDKYNSNKSKIQELQEIQVNNRNNFLEINNKIQEIQVNNINNFSEINNKITDVGSHLEHIENKQYLNFLDFGVPNDKNIDNTPYLKKALDELNKTGGTLIIPEGEWYFKTPLKYDKWLLGSKICGTGRGVLNSETSTQVSKGLFGTRLTYQGDGTFLTFNGKMNTVTLENMAINLTSETSYALKLNYTFHRGIIKDINISGGSGAIELNTGTYVSIEGVRYSTSSTVAEYGVRIGLTDTDYTTEFIYIDKCSFDFGKQSNANGIEIFKCSGAVWLSRLDICNTLGTGFLIDNKNNKSINYFNLRDVNFSGVSVATEFIPRTGNIGGIFMDGIRQGFNNQSVNEKFIYVHRENTSYVVSLNVVKTYLRMLNTNIIPEYIIYLDGCNASETFIELTSGDNKNKLTSPIFMSNNCIIDDYRITYAGKININFNDETPTGTNANYKDYKLKISDMYHTKNYKPIIMFTSNTYQQVGFIKSEIKDGVLYAYIRVPIDLTTSTINLYYNIIKDDLYY